MANRTYLIELASRLQSLPLTTPEWKRILDDWAYELKKAVSNWETLEQAQVQQAFMAQFNRQEVGELRRELDALKLQLSDLQKAYDELLKSPHNQI